MISFVMMARAALASAVLAFSLGSAAYANGDRDSLFVGDGVDNNVKVFDAITGTFLRSLPTARAPVLGPRGIVLRSDNLFLVNQNVGTDFNGEILRFSAVTGRLRGAVVSGTRSDAPFAPRGLILWRDHLFVANVCDPCRPPGETGGGGVFKYTAAGQQVAVLPVPPQQPPPDFHPFGVVIGPDGLLYVSSRPNLFSTDLGGQVLQFDPKTGKLLKTFISSVGGDNRLNGPEGLVFGPDGRLYVTSFRGSDQDTDKILIFDGPGSAQPGRQVGKIDLDEVRADRSTAQTLLFGPGGDLFVPISNIEIDAGADTGAIRRYRIGCRQTATRKCFTNFVNPADKRGKLGQGWYLTFGKTDPATLAYRGD